MKTTAVSEIAVVVTADGDGDGSTDLHGQHITDAGIFDVLAKSWTSQQLPRRVDAYCTGGV